MATLAIWMLIAFGVLTLGVRAAIQVRRTGSTGLIGLRAGAGVADWVSGILFVGGMAMGAGSIVLVLNDSLEPIDALDVDGVHAAGIALAAAGGLAVFGAQLGMGESWRIGVSDEERTDLITGGWFSLCRNPIYTAMIVGWLGFALLVPTWLGFAAVVVIAAGLELQVRFVEEPYLIRIHGDAYQAYTSRVGRFLPGIGRLS
ncbi:MAG TPA: isoprenylcysteine carboxylmethyltransferase family protein [Solirubrobacterales bacterium]|nr:isoprenylcysteine carboxylmethyltransferase family protein [Solirubrobacterales bacterium]